MNDAHRKVYNLLLGLAESADVGLYLEGLLDALVEAADAKRGYLETSDPIRATSWRIARGCTDLEREAIRSVTSRGIVAAAHAEGTTVHTPKALLDERFLSLESVQEQQLEAVLCVPFKRRSEGVVYLEGHAGKGPFPDDVVALVEDVAAHAGAHVIRAAASAVELRAGDPTSRFRDQLDLSGVLGKSQSLARVFEQLVVVAPLDLNVLLTGESGTGKTQVARAIHANSPRRAAPFVELNCAALPEGLIESELFGTTAGAFTGARRNPGKVEAAEGGTLFLDEIADVPFAAQAKLLQLLQSKEYYPLGSAQVSRANVRVIAATNADLEQLVRAKRFREDLMYRLAVLPIRMPSLRERVDDIRPIVTGLVARICRELGVAPLAPSPKLLEYCEAQSWPGNVRQLRNRLEAACARATFDRVEQLEVSHFAPDQTSPSGPLSYQEATRAFQRELVRRELDSTDWNITEVARRLDLTRSHVYNLVHGFQLKRGSNDGSET